MLNILLKAEQPPQGGGWEKIPQGKHGGYRKRTGSGFEYWYPTDTPTKPTQDDESLVVQKDPTKQRTMGVSEKTINSLVYRMLPKVLENKDNPSFRKVSNRVPMTRPDGKKTMLGINFFVQRSKSTVSGDYDDKRKEINITIPYDFKPSSRGDNIHEVTRAVLAHELNHALDPKVSRELPEDYEEQGESYYNTPVEVNAYREMIFRELNTPKVAQEVKEEIESWQADKEEAKELREWLQEEGQSSLHIKVGKQYLSTDQVMEFIDKFAPTWKEVSRHLNAKNKKTMLKTAATVLAAHAYGVSNPVEKSLNPFSILLRN